MSQINICFCLLKSVSNYESLNAVLNSSRFESELLLLTFSKLSPYNYIFTYNHFKICATGTTIGTWQEYAGRFENVD